MYGILLVTHVASSVLMILYTVFTFLGALLRRGSLRASKVVLLVSGTLTVMTGFGLGHVTGQSWGRVCLPASALLLVAWAAYAALRWRLIAPVQA